MPRIRTIKPEFFKHEGIAALPYHTRLAFIGLWTLADRDGRLEDRPRRIKTVAERYYIHVTSTHVSNNFEKFLAYYSQLAIGSLPGFNMVP